ncbi:ferredoxin [Mycobacterium riyadhense]|uniref:4Fe-4S ferredoxin-type domain-containing protein n=1 Tax=Mycobacterium riyadhense TaxID=486698 RepID=A0A1X2D513_9MYCO|nr:ferredoxin [Mycobacterium riyadhense]MCV7147407.1 ferredoxin [Mycobacterium riyadhense]ORW83024.1 hypothetical protein AWC22_15510 [Mycobacterium riyadhense]VTP02850.1 Ferredoxin [Mycobacterium riyadhense]
MWRIEVDTNRCMGTRACVHAIPGLFDIGHDGVAHVIGVANGDDELVRDVVAECPTAALRLMQTVLVRK